MPKTPVCRVCGGKVVHGNLYCCHACGDGRVSHSATRQILETHGFTLDPDISNVYLKDGVAVTLEMVNHVGLEKALVQHAAVVAIHARAGISQPTEAH